jgi:chromate transporter
MKISAWMQLAAVFGPLSLLSFGGGQAVMGDMQKEVVTHHHWMSQAQFLEDFAVSRASAGPNSMIVPLIGWQVDGLTGVMAATLAIFVPSSVVFYALTRAWHWRAFGTWPRKVGRGLAPISVGLSLGSSVTLLAAERDDPVAWIVTGAATVVLVLTRLNPVIVMAAGALVFVAKGLIFPG